MAEPGRSPPSIPGFGRRFWAPFALGLVGVASLPAALSQQLVRTALPEPLASMPYPAAVALSLVNPMILLVGASLAGALLAHRVGLASACAGTAGSLSARHGLQAAAAGLLLALLLYALDRLLAPLLGPQAQALRTAGTGSVAALAAGMLYGGITEEVLMRWGLMSLAAWGLQRLVTRGQPLGKRLWWVAITAAALVFAAGHLPALAALTEPTPALVARTLLLNLCAGLVYGAFFWRRQLESAMLAHASTHVGFWLLARAAGAS